MQIKTLQRGYQFIHPEGILAGAFSGVYFRLGFTPMSFDLLTELKNLQFQRSDVSPFASHVDFLTWTDTVTGLLSFDTSLQKRFRFWVDNANFHHDTNSSHISAINEAIGVLNQAITSLEVVAIPNTTPNPTANSAHNEINKVKFLSFPKGSSLVRVAVEAFVMIIATFVLYLFKSQLGVPL